MIQVEKVGATTEGSVRPDNRPVAGRWPTILRSFLGGPLSRSEGCLPPDVLFLEGGEGPVVIYAMSSSYVVYSAPGFLLGTSIRSTASLREASRASPAMSPGVVLVWSPTSWADVVDASALSLPPPLEPGDMSLLKASFRW